MAETSSFKVDESVCGFFVGKYGHTKDKVARASGTNITFNPRQMELLISGSARGREKALQYLKALEAQRRGSIQAPKGGFENCTMVQVPYVTIGYVTGVRGGSLRFIEDKHNVVMFFSKVVSESGKASSETESLLIFGDEFNRKCAELKIMAAAEQKLRNCFSTDILRNGLEKQVFDGFVLDYRLISGQDMGYALGRHGWSRRKISDASGATVEYVGRICFICGPEDKVAKAKEYLDMFFQQIHETSQTENSLRKTLKSDTRSDCSVAYVLADCVGYVAGKNRQALSLVEEDKGVLMFFCQKFADQSEIPNEPGRDAFAITPLVQPRGTGCTEKKGFEELVIFGQPRNRLAAQLKIMGMLEAKLHGLYSHKMEVRSSQSTGYDIEALEMQPDEVSFVLGRGGATRRKIALAANCVLEYVGRFAIFSGTLEERRACQDCLHWLLIQRRSRVTLTSVDLKNKNHFSEFTLTKNQMNYITRNKAYTLRQAEADTKTFIFMATNEFGVDRLVIFGFCEKMREYASTLIREALQHNCWNDEETRSPMHSYSYGSTDSRESSYLDDYNGDSENHYNGSFWSSKNRSSYGEPQHSQHYRGGFPEELEAMDHSYEHRRSEGRGRNDLDLLWYGGHWDSTRDRRRNRSSRSPTVPRRNSRSPPPRRRDHPSLHIYDDWHGIYEEPLKGEPYPSNHPKHSKMLSNRLRRPRARGFHELDYSHKRRSRSYSSDGTEYSSRSSYDTPLRRTKRRNH